MFAELLLCAVLSRMPGAVPATIMSEPGSGVTAWVSERLAIDDNGALSTSVLAEHDVERLNRAANRPSQAAGDAPCKTTVGRVLHQTGDRGSVRELTESAHAVFTGRISAQEQGFLFGQPGTLFAIDV